MKVVNHFKSISPEETAMIFYRIIETITIAREKESVDDEGSICPPIVGQKRQCFNRISD